MHDVALNILLLSIVRFQSVSLLEFCLFLVTYVDVRRQTGSIAESRLLFQVCGDYPLQNPGIARHDLLVIIFMNPHLLESMTLVEHLGSRIRHLDVEINAADFWLCMRRGSSKDQLQALRTQSSRTVWLHTEVKSILATYRHDPGI
jgi:hypothetical protein